MPATPYGIEQGILYFSTVTAGATPAAGNQLADVRGEPTVNITHASALWRGQDRFPKNAVLHTADARATIPGVTFDHSMALTKLMNGTNTAATTLHGGTAAARESKVVLNTKPLLGEYLWHGKMTSTGSTVQLLFHNAFITGVSPTLGATDFNTFDIDLTLLADGNGDVFSVFEAV